jgi:AAA domain, putative AbiEii toxin, Type IV TA system/AAA domain
MRVLDIELKNYRKFKEFRCEFHPRFTLLAGENGSGKTSLIKGFFSGGISCLFAHVQLGTKQIEDIDVRRTSSVDVADEQWQSKYYPCESFSNIEIFQPGSNIMQWAGVIGAVKHSENYPSWEYRTPNVSAHQAKPIFEDFFNESNTQVIPLVARYDAIKPVLGQPSNSVAKPFQQKKDILSQIFNPAALNTGTLASWFQHYALRGLQEKTQPLIYRKVREAVLSAIHAEDINFIVRDNALEIRYEGQGWRSFNDLSDGQQRIAGIFCDLALRCASLNSHLGEDCITATTGIVTIDELDLHLHPKWQKQVVGDLLRTFPNIQFIVTSHSPFLLQAAFEHGAVVDMATGSFMQAQDLSIEDIAEVNMGVSEVQRGQRFIQMKNVAKEYYQLLEKIPLATDSEKQALKAKLDELLIPYSNDPAYAAWLEMHRHAAGV